MSAVTQVSVVEYDPAWVRMFEGLRSRILDRLGDLPLEVEHVGGTAVPGLASKPVVDLDVVVASAADVPAAIEGLAALGYVHDGDLGVRGREAFRWPPGYARHHLYVVVSGSAAHRDHVAFRDYLIDHPDEARAYAALKQELARAHRDDRDAYSRGKAAFVERVLDQAAA